MKNFNFNYLQLFFAILFLNLMIFSNSYADFYIYTEPSGTFDDGSGSGVYKIDQIDTFLIQPVNALSITITFTEFDVENDGDYNCYDKVQVWDGPSPGTNLIGEYCSNPSSPLNIPLTSTGGSICIVFISDYSEVQNGWTLEYTSQICTNTPVLETYWSQNEENIYYNGNNVGIGTDSPQAKLHVAGKILAEGEIEVIELTAQNVSADNIKATDINLELNNAADYVFNENYNLKSLAEVEQFIKANKHLPNIPSAEEFTENGMNVSEMNNLLLEKVEELTLYIIDLEKKIVKLENEK